MLCLLVLIISMVGVNAQSEKLPNVIFIMADDLGIGDLGSYGQKHIKTPYLDQLAKQGVRFAQHYAGAPVCGPSRASLITGQHTGNTAIRGNKLVGAADDLFDFPLPAKEVTLAEIMKQRNYATACIGKWGLGGPDSEGSPNKQGFEYFFGFLNQAAAHKHYPEFIYENAEKLAYNKKIYAHDAMEQKALEFIDKNHSKPFFLYFVPTIPHAELKVPEDNVGIYDGLFPEKPFAGDPTGKGFSPQAKPIATYAAMISRLDETVGKIMSRLQDLGIDKNTLIIFTSDNGVHDKGGYNPDILDSNGPFRGVKRDMYEGGIRSPFIVKWPAKITAGTSNFHVSAFYDLLPTLCDIIKVPQPKNTDGISFLPALTGIGKQPKHDFLYWELHENGGLQAVLKNNWKLIRFNADTKKYRYELYNLNSDPGEMMDVASQYPVLVKQYALLMDQSHTLNTNFPFGYEISKK